MAVSVSVQPCKPRTCGQQRNRPNVATVSIEKWYKINVAIPFIDHIINDVEAHFSPLTKTSSKVLCLVPSLLCNGEVEFAEVIEMYTLVICHF